MGIQDLRARTAARKSAGESQHYPEHAGKAARRTAAPTALPLLAREPCHYEGIVLEHCHTCSGEARSVRECDLHERATRVYVSDKARACERCPTYAAPERMGDPACGVAIGSYHWPELVDLQIRLTRAMCGPVPILVSNDHPESAAALDVVCRAHPDVTLHTNPERLGHTGGDLAVFHRGIAWGAERGLTVVAKVSQRLFFTSPYWLQDAAKNLLASGLPVGIRKATGDIGGRKYPLRTELALLDVRQCCDVPSLLPIGTYWHQRPGGWPAENIVDELVRDRLGGAYWPCDLLPTLRQQKQPGVVWHHANPRADYEALAAKHGVTLPADFHTGGWENEYRDGLYRYG